MQEDDKGSDMVNLLSAAEAAQLFSAPKTDGANRGIKLESAKRKEGKEGKTYNQSSDQYDGEKRAHTNMSHTGTLSQPAHVLARTFSAFARAAAGGTLFLRRWRLSLPRADVSLAKARVADL